MKKVRFLFVSVLFFVMFMSSVKAFPSSITLDTAIDHLTLDLDTLYHNGVLSTQAWTNMKSVLKSEYKKYKKKAPKIENKKIDIRESTKEFEEFVKVTKQSVVPVKRRKAPHSEFVAFQKDNVNSN